MSYIFLNPGGEHLGFPYIPLPKLYIFFTVAWVVLAGLWCFNWIWHRQQRIKLHRVITLFPILKAAVAAYALGYWQHWSNVGMCECAWICSEKKKGNSLAELYIWYAGSASVGLVLGYWLLYILFKAVFYTVLLLIAKGWRITRDKIGNNKFVIAAIISSLTITLLIGILFTGFFMVLL